MHKKVLITGALGQIGSELAIELRQRYGEQNVICSDLRQPASHHSCNGTFEQLDVTRQKAVAEVVAKHQIDTIYHMAAILSATGEKDPALAWRVNAEGMYNVLEASRENGVRQVFCPSSIAVFGSDAAKDNTPQTTVLHPQTMYGITKATGELLGSYYFQRFGLDVRGVRYPGLISSKTLPGGGTTDYAVEIFYEAVKNKRYDCFVSEQTVLPMMYMPDAIRGTIQLMETPLTSLHHHVDFNISAMSFSAGELAAEITKHIPDFVCTFSPDFRQKFADSWPRTIDDSCARSEWGWQPQYDLSSMTIDMLENLRQRIEDC